MEFIIMYCAQLACAAGFGYVLNIAKKRKTENDATQAGLRSLLRDRLIQAYNHYADTKGYCPIYARENITLMYDSYHNLGGNGTITELYKKLMKLPTEKGSE